MKFRSILSFSLELRTNVIFCLILLSVVSLISSVRISPAEPKIKSIWNTDTIFINCKRSDRQNAGTLKWYSPSGQPIDDNNKAPVHVQESPDSVKLFLMNVPKKHSGSYECRHTLDGKTISSDKFELKVYSSIDMEGNKDSYIGTEGHQFSMTCFARFDSDSNEAKISWIFNNLAIKDREGDFSVTQRVEQSVTQKSVKSTLNIRRLTKEMEGIYVCQSEYGNNYLTDMKQIDINLRVQFKPRFPENTQKNVWISDEQKSPVVVNVTCLVNADPVAQFQWLTGRGVPLEQVRLPIQHSIQTTENLSVLSLTYRDLNAIRNDMRNREPLLRKFQCKARNVIGEEIQTFELNIGKLPEPPILDKYSYDKYNGILVLTINETEVEPPIDIYRIDINSNHQIYFNASNRNPLANNTFEVIIDVPIGTHQMLVHAHNPVGWSEFRQGQEVAMELVISSASAAQQYLAIVLMASALASVYAL